MKYLQPYDNQNKLEELSDYLQEFFDTHQIKEIRSFDPVQPNLPCWCFLNVIYIFINSENYNKICSHLDEITPLIEKRLGQRIYTKRESPASGMLFGQITIGI